MYNNSYRWHVLCNDDDQNNKYFTSLAGVFFCRVMLFVVSLGLLCEIFRPSLQTFPVLISFFMGAFLLHVCISFPIT